MPHAHGSLLAEVQDTIESGSSEKRGELLRRVTGLFLDNASQLSEDQVGVFDQVIGLLIKKIETKALAELSTRLALVANAPINVIRTLAYDDEIAVAKPVITHSVRLSGEDLLAIAKTKSQKHLQAMSARRQLDAIVTDVLLERGDLSTIDRLVENPGAHFSDSGLRELVRRAEADESLTEKLGCRIDFPTALFEQLLTKATEEVRRRLLANAPFERRGALLSAINVAAAEVRDEVAIPRDLADTLLNLLQLKKSGALDEAALAGFARARQYEEMVVALGLMCSASLSVVEPLMRNPRSDGVLVPCKAANLSWSTVESVLQNRLPGHSLSNLDLSRAKTDYDRLSQATAQRLLRFWQVRTPVAEQERMTDNRARSRRLTLEPAMVEIAQDGGLIDCVVLDLAKGGACILVRHADSLPQRFQLRIESTGASHTCSVAWRRSNRVGVTFLDEGSSHSVTRH